MGLFVGGKRGAISDVNVVPLIDILLVLLVIFMIIPVRRQGLDAKIPQPGPVELRPQSVDVVVVQVMADGTLLINQEPTARESLGGRLEEIFGSRLGRTAFIRGDGEVKFAVVASVISVMHSSGVESVGLLTPGLEKASRF
jgi:biopolymer transport protein TolR